ncbi:MAG: hypothetical protein HKN04_06690 [Rhodothermaceae bacterium]|nr:hypothetical protein [Rhodothermaceae bacterium]
MLDARPDALGAWRFTLTENKQPIATVRLRRKDEATIMVGEVPFAMGTNRKRTHFVLMFEGVEVARARQPSLLSRRLDVRVSGTMLDRPHAVAEAADVVLKLQAASPFVRTFEVWDGAQLIGRVRPRHPFTRRTEITLPPSLPPAVQAFLFALAAIQWRRAQRRSG